jgi:CMP-N-acetylneuraminic acid synthetase
VVKKLFSIAIIPARAGSKGLVDKNILELCGHPLLAWSIFAAKKSNFDDVIVSTDSKAYAEIAQSYGAKVPFLRPKALAGGKATDDQFLNHAIKELNKDGISAKYIAHLRPTTPSRHVSLLNDALNHIESIHVPYLRSCHQAAESPMKWYYKRKHRGVSLSEEHLDMKPNLPRQLFENVYVPNGYIDILNVDHFVREQDLYLNDLGIFETEEVIEIDNQHDFDILKESANGRDSGIYMELIQ